MITNKVSNQDQMPFGKQNYTLLIIGIVIIMSGFFVMTLDKVEFGFGSLGITIGPMIVLSGFALEFYAILKRK